MTASAFGGTFAFFHLHKAKQKKQKSHQPTHKDSNGRKSTTGNSMQAIAAVSVLIWKFVFLL
jgi:hypothetical protein